MHHHAPLSELSRDELEERICKQAAHIAAATYRWLELLAEFDRRGGWADIGIKSIAHWLSWKCGVDLHTAREYVRVARAIEHLPAISASFSRGELSYAKVRALTRMATPETEEQLLVFARNGTASHVEKLVRGYRKCLPPDPDDVEHGYKRRSVEWSYDDDGMGVLKAKLPAEELALLVDAIRMIAEEKSRTNRVPGGAEDGSAEPPWDRADAIVEIARMVLAGEKEVSSSADRYQVFIHVDAAALDGDGGCRLEEGAGIATTTAQRLLCDSSAIAVVRDTDGTVLDLGRKTRTITPALKRALNLRDGGCVFPSCTAWRFIDGHHIEHWVEGGETKLSNLASLCPFHHRLMHEGGFTMRMEADGTFTFMREDGSVIKTQPIAVEPGGVEQENALLGLAVDGKTITSQWKGERCDYGVAVEYTLRKDHPELFQPKNVPAGTFRSAAGYAPERALVAAQRTAYRV